MFGSLAVFSHWFVPAGPLARWALKDCIMAVNVGRLGRRKGISHSGLSAVLEDLKGQEFPSATSRQTIKRRRDEDVNVNTRFGPLLQNWNVTLPPMERKKKKSGVKTKAKPEKPVEFPFVQPVPLLSHMCLECAEFSAMMLKVIDEHTPSQEHPLKLIVYSDGVSPGNVLAHNQTRKVEVMYWSIQEFGDLALAMEKNWFLLGVARHDHVKRLPGQMSQYFREGVERFFTPVDVRQGIQLTFAGGQRRIIFLELSIVVGDEVALKECMDIKGASGTVLCPLCRNLVDWKSNLHMHSEELIPSNNPSLNGIDFHTDETVLATVRYLSEQKGSMSNARFKKQEQALGFNHNELGFLHSQIIRLRPVSALMFDWMHTYCVSGLWNVETGLLLSKLDSVGLTQGLIDSEVKKYVWPRSLSSRGVTGIGIFEKEDQEGDVKCSASECLSIYAVLRCIFMHVRERREFQRFKKELDSYFRLCRVLDLLSWQKKRGWNHQLLQEAIQAHMQGYIRCYDRVLPKHHYSLRLASQCAQHGTLVSCWVHERKHKEVKRHANLIANISSNFERSVIVDAMGDSLAALSGTAHEPCHGGLCNPSAGLAAGVASELANLGFSGPIEVSRSAFVHAGQQVFNDDVVLLSDGGERHVGKVNFFAQCGAEQLSCISLMQKVSSNVFVLSANTAVVAAFENILDVCIHSPQAEGRYKVVPMTTW